MTIIDCHIHPQTDGDYHADISDLVRRMMKHRIGKAVISDLGDGWKAFPDNETLIAANERVRRESLNSGGRLEYLVYINPQNPGWEDIFYRFYGNSCGVKLWISLRSEEYGIERTKDVLRLAAKYDKTVLIHTFDRTDPGQIGQIGMSEVIALANAVPDCRIVAAHSGGNWRNAISLAPDVPDNVFLDISGSYPERGMVRRLVDAFGSDRVLYGSDAFGRSFGSQLSKVFGCGLDEEALGNILYRNSMRVFGISQAEPVPAGSPPSWSIPEPQTDNFCFSGSSPYWDHNVSAAELVQSAAERGVDVLYAASLEALTCVDKISANIRYKEQCAEFPQIRCLAVVDLGNMSEAVSQLDQLDGFAGVLISPYLHQYHLEYGSFAEFFDLCSKRDIPVWINTALSDDRFRDARLKTRVVTVDDVISFLAEAPPCRFTFQGCPPDVRLSRVLPGNCRLECSRLSDSEYAPDQLFSDGCPEKLCFGSEYPFREYSCVQSILAGRL